MAISLINNPWSCTTSLQLSSSSSTFYRFNGASNSPLPIITISFAKLNNHFHKFQYTTTSLKKTQETNPLFHRRSSRRILCSHGDNEIPGVAAKVIEEYSDTSLAMKNKAIDISPALKGTSIFLVGMKSTMKTNLAKLLADILKYYYFDSDSLVEQAAGGESAAKNLRESDESGFRDSETEVLKQLSSMGRLVVCAGDGAVQSSTNLSFLRYGISIWIDVPLDMLAAEVIGNGNESPFSTLDPYSSSSSSSSHVIANLSKEYQEIRDGYATADATISLQKVAYKLGYEDMYTVTTEDMALETLKEIEKLTRVKKMMEAAATPF